MTSPITLYGMGQSRSFRALWAAEEAGIDFTYVQVEFKGTGENGAQGSQYKKLNFQGKVPTLVDGDLVVRESAAILNYIATKAVGQVLMPADGTAARAAYDEICFFILSEFEQPLWTHGKHKFVLPEQYRVADVIETTLPFEFAKAQAALLVILGDREYAAGDSFTMADVLLAQTINWAQRFNFSLDEKLLNYRDKMVARDAFARALKQTEQ